MKYVNITPVFSSSSPTDGVSIIITPTSINAYMAFDNNNSTHYRSSIAPSLPEYIGLAYPSGRVVKRYSIVLGGAGTYSAMTGWELQASNDEFSTINTLHSIAGHVPVGGKVEVFDLTNNQSFKSYRIKVISREGTNSWGLSELKFYEIDYEKKTLVYHNNVYKKYDASTEIWEKVTVSTSNDYITYGMDDVSTIPESAWSELQGEVELCYFTEDESVEDVLFNIETEPFTLSQEWDGQTIKVIEYSDNPNQTESIISVETEPLSVYDVLGDKVDVLYYTDDPTITKPELEVIANYSPLDEIEGDFDVVTWSDEAPETAKRELVMEALPKPQFIKLMKPKQLYGELNNVFVNEVSKSFRNEARYFLASVTPDKWYVWDKKIKKFVASDVSTEKAIMDNGMTYKDLNGITDAQWGTWEFEYINIGMYLIDNVHDTTKTIIENISYEATLPRHTQTIENTSLYILNTTAKIDVSFNGNILKGVLSDADLTRVQYRVLINNGYYYPSDGNFTKLGESPQDIEVVIASKDIKIDDWNTLKIEFQDFFGTTDYWSTQFMGTYSGLMFKDIYGEYFSSEIGEVLQYLDFGIIIAGQTTVEHEVVLKNQYGYDVKNVHLSANTENFPQGMTIEFSQSLSPFTPQPDLRLSGVLLNNEEMSFFTRLKSELGATPDANGSFDIIVRAEKA